MAQKVLVNEAPGRRSAAPPGSPQSRPTQDRKRQQQFLRSKTNETWLSRFRSRWKAWLIAAAVIGGLLGLAEWLRSSDAELARREISALEGELKVTNAERIEHAAQYQALAAVNGGELVRKCQEMLVSRLRLDAERTWSINQQIKQPRALEQAAPMP